MAEYGIGPGSSPALRSPGHGVWQREHGSHDYSFAFIVLPIRCQRCFHRIAENYGCPETRSKRPKIATSSVIETLDVDDNSSAPAAPPPLGHGLSNTPISRLSRRFRQYACRVGKCPPEGGHYPR